MFFYSKRSFFISVAFAIFAISSSWYVYSDNIRLVRTSKIKSDFITSEIYGLKYHNNDNNGIKHFKINAKEFFQYENDYLKAYKVHIQGYDLKTNKKNIDITSNWAKSKDPKNTTNVVELYGNVHIVAYVTDKNKSKKIIIDTSKIFYDPKTKEFNNNVLVKIFDPLTGNTTTGIGIKGNMNIQKITLKKNIRSYYEAI